MWGDGILIPPEVSWYIIYQVNQALSRLLEKMKGIKFNQALQNHNWKILM